MMIQAQFNLEESQFKFLEQYHVYGFLDSSAVVRTALNRLSLELESQKILRDSANLYAELYEVDEETKELTDSALLGWPT